jgi:hypothetical protein
MFQKLAMPKVGSAAEAGPASVLKRSGGEAPVKRAND